MPWLLNLSTGENGLWATIVLFLDLVCKPASYRKSWGSYMLFSTKPKTRQTKKTLVRLKEEDLIYRDDSNLLQTSDHCCVFIHAASLRHPRRCEHWLLKDINDILMVSITLDFLTGHWTTLYAARGVKNLFCINSTLSTTF